jgi:hypothetical protein
MQWTNVFTSILNLRVESFRPRKNVSLPRGAGAQIRFPFFNGTSILFIFAIYILTRVQFFGRQFRCAQMDPSVWSISILFSRFFRAFSCCWTAMYFVVQISAVFFYGADSCFRTTTSLCESSLFSAGSFCTNIHAAFVNNCSHLLFNRFNPGTLSHEK